MAKDIAALKAVSQNQMHSNISITDGIYGILSNNDIKAQIGRISDGTSSRENLNNEQLILLIQDFRLISAHDTMWA